MTPKDPLFDLGKRERQIVEAVYRLGEASVSDVLAAIADPPRYSSVRAMLGTLVQKDVLAYRHEGKRYLYRPVASKGETQGSPVRRLVAGLFGAGLPMRWRPCSTWPAGLSPTRNWTVSGS